MATPRHGHDYSETVPNALAFETSPYLRQHASNPVQWLPWGPAALAAARERDVPLLVSIGYSSCHWCHVMEHESFEDPRVAALMNEEFVCVKVDREERPDIDALYMEAVQGMSWHGGWPLNVFLTPEQLPFYGGTYFPPEPRHGMPSWTQVLHAIAETWREQAPEIRAGGERIGAQLAGGARLQPSAAAIEAHALGAAVERLQESFDTVHGGFGGAPKFPQAPVLEFLLARAAGDTGASAAQMALATLHAMAAGGIHDQVGGGFHRYAVDATWTVPHFEKMLYDNALLARAYLHGFQLSGDERLRRTCEDTLDWALREMRAPEGGFYSALDADSDGGEGSFYVWSIQALGTALGEDAATAIAWFGATATGNFAGESGTEVGLNVLEAHGPEPPSNRDQDAPSSDGGQGEPPSTRDQDAPSPDHSQDAPPPDRDQTALGSGESSRRGQRERIRAHLLEARAQRPRPSLDDKRLTSWNALMIAALADAGAVLQRADYLQAASACAEFVLRELRGDGGLLRTYSHGRATLNGYLEDYAFLVEALIALYEATFQERWFEAARALADEMIDRFADPERGGFFSTASDHEALIARRKDLDDAPIPSGGSAAALGLLRLAALTGEQEYERQAMGVLRLAHELAPRHPTAFGHLLQAIDFYVAPTREVAIVGPPGPTRDALESLVRARPRARLVLAGGRGEGPTAVPLVADRTALDGRPTAYVCERFACRRPVTEPEELAALLSELDS
jgi:uncharacterized protein YyaL (SSP411 family)